LINLNIQKSVIHTVNAQPTILPYSEVPRWAYQNVNTQAQTITKKKGNTIDALNADNFHQIYKLPKPLVFMNKGFLENFTKENPKPLDIIQD
jgi:hypothetical protein